MTTPEKPSALLWVVRSETIRYAGQRDRLKRLVIMEGNKLIASLDGPFLGDDADKRAIFDSIARLHNEELEVLAALNKTVGALRLVLNPLDAEELSQPIFKECAKAYDEGFTQLSRSSVSV